MDGSGDRLVLDAPAEDTDHVTGPTVDFVPAETGIDHRLPNRFEGQRPELLRQGVAVESTKGPDAVTDVVRLPRGRAVLAIVAVRPLEVGQEQFVDAQVGGAAPFGAGRDLIR
jgi:hypothetical protein